MTRLARPFATLAVAVALPATAIGVVRAGDDVVAEMLEDADEAAAERKAAAPKAALDAQAARIATHIEAYTPRCRPVARAEVHFILRACSPTDDQRVILIREGEQALRGSVRAYAERVVLSGNTMVIVGERTPGEKATDLLTMIREAMAVVVERELSPEQVAAYRKEVVARAAIEKSVALQNLVARLDEALSLDADQRAEISGSLADEWDSNWRLSVQNYQAARRNVPAIPDQLLVPFLSPSQREAWAKATKVNLVRASLGILSNAGDTAIEEEPDDTLKGKD